MQILLALLFALGITLDPTTPLQTGVALNGSQASRTSVGIPVAGKSILRLKYDYTRSSGSDFKIFCEQSDVGTSAATDWRNIDLPDASGVLSPGAALYSYATIAASRIFDVRIGVATMRWVRCYATVTAAGAGDLITSTYTTW